MKLSASETLLCVIFAASFVGGAAGLMAAEIASTLRDGGSLIANAWRVGLRWVRK